jgi:hypothetical protein
MSRPGGTKGFVALGAPITLPMASLITTHNINGGRR